LSVKKDVEYIEDYFSAVQPSTGGTICEFAEYQLSLGNPIFRSNSVNQVWVRGNRSDLQRFPLECTDEVNRKTFNKLLKERTIWIANYLVEPSNTDRANCFNYICEDSGYNVDNFSSARARRDIRRGLRNFNIRLCNNEELASKGYNAYKDTAIRHNYSVPDRNKYFQNTKKLSSQFYDIWGAWDDAGLMAWMTVIKIDDWAMIESARSCTQALKKSPNDALIYSATKYLMNDEKRKYITYGLSSIQADVNELSMHRYKIKVGYKAIPMCRKFAVHSLLHPLVYPKISSWTLEKLAKFFPRYAKLRKIAGISRILSGRERESLNWVNKQ